MKQAMALLLMAGMLALPFAHAESYGYDAMGRLIQVVTLGAQTNFTYDASGNPVASATVSTKWINADSNTDNRVDLGELLRMVQFYNADALHCDGSTEDGFAPGTGAQDCTNHTGDYAPADWVVTLTELLRAIQYFNSQGYTWCPESPSEDDFCPGLS